MAKEFKSFFKTVGGNEGTLCHYPTRLDLYGCGCAHDCGYCYARALLDFRGLWNPTDPARADIEKVRRKIKKLHAGGVVRLGGMTDCFQPVEREAGLTYEAIKALNAQGVGYLIVTKSALVADEKYLAIYDKRLAHFQISITSTNNATAATYEKASAVSDRIKAAEKLEALGFDVCLRLSPFIPEFIDIDIVNAVKVHKILVEFLRANTFIKKTFPIDYTPYIHKSGNYNHLPLDAKLALLDRIKGHEVTVCDDVPEHYEHFREHFNPNPCDCCNLRRSI